MKIKLFAALIFAMLLSIAVGNTALAIKLNCSTCGRWQEATFQCYVYRIIDFIVKKFCVMFVEMLRNGIKPAMRNPVQRPALNRPTAIFATAISAKQSRITGRR